MKTHLPPSVALRLLTILALVATSARAQSARPTVKWQPLIENASVDVDEVFPAEILAVAARHVQQKASPRYLGDPNGALGVVLVPAN